MTINPEFIAVVQLVCSMAIIPLVSTIWGMNNRLTRLEERLIALQKATLKNACK